MSHFSLADEQYLQVRRVIALIAYANTKIDDQERMLLASSMAGYYQLSEEQIQSLVEDATQNPRIEDLVGTINDSRFLRLLLNDLMTLAIAKEEWEELELTAASQVINALPLQEDLVIKIRQAFNLLLGVAEGIYTQ